MKISLDHFESKYGTYTGKRVLFAINCLTFYIVMMIAVNNLGINPFTAFSNVTKAINTVLGIRTFEDIVSESTIGVLDSTVSSVTMYNTVFMLMMIIIPIMFIVQCIHIGVRVFKVTRLGKKYREPESYFTAENNLQIGRHFVLMLILICVTVCLLLPVYTEPNMFFGDDSLGVAEFLTISAVRASYSSGLYDFQTSMILSMLFAILSVAFLYVLSSGITILICSVTSSLEGTLGKEIRQIFILDAILVFGAKYASQYITAPFIEPPVVLHYNFVSIALIVLCVVGTVLGFIPLGRKIDSEK